MIQERQYKYGEHVFVAGDPKKSIVYKIQDNSDGVVGLEIIRQDRTPAIIYTARAGEYFGLEAFFENQQQVSAKVLTPDVIIQEYPTDSLDLETLLRSIAYQQRAKEELSELLQRTKSDKKDLIVYALLDLAEENSAEGQLETVVRFTQIIIGQRAAGISREGTSRIFSKLNGMVSRRKNKIVIFDKEALQREVNLPRFRHDREL